MVAGNFDQEIVQIRRREQKASLHPTSRANSNHIVRTDRRDGDGLRLLGRTLANGENASTLLAKRAEASVSGSALVNQHIRDVHHENGRLICNARERD